MYYPDYNAQLKAIQGQIAGLQNPFPQSPTTPEPAQMQVKGVTGLKGAVQFLQTMPANSSAIVADDEEEYVYTLKKDANSVESIFKSTVKWERVNSVNGDEVVTKKDFESFKEEIRGLLGKDDK